MGLRRVSLNWLSDLIQESPEPQVIVFIDSLDVLGTKKVIRNLDDFFDLPTIMMIDVNKNPKALGWFEVASTPTTILWSPEAGEVSRYVGTEYKPMMGLVLEMVRERKALLAEAEGVRS